MYSESQWKQALILSAFAQAMAKLPLDQTAKLVEAAEISLDYLPLSEERKNEIWEQVGESSMVQTLLVVDKVWSGGSGAEGAPGVDPQMNQPSVAAQEIINSLASFMGLGGDLDDLERRVELEHHVLQNEMPSWLRGLSLGTRDVVEGLVGLVDDPITVLIRNPLNWINAKLGGDPNYLKPFAPVLADMLGLATPETPLEKLLSNIRQGLTSLPVVWAAGSAMAAQKGGAALPTLAQAVGKMLSGTPKMDVAETIGSATASSLAQQAGAGPGGTIVSSIIGGIAGAKTAGKAATSMTKDNTAASKTVAEGPVLGKAETALEAGASPEAKAAKAAANAAELSQYKHLFNDHVKANRHMIDGESVIENGVFIEAGKFTQTKGLSGCHRADHFEAAKEKYGLEIVKDQPYVNGIKTIKYKILALDKQGKRESWHKTKTFEQTIYDPTVHTDEQMLLYAAQAAEKGLPKALEKGVREFGASSNGVSFWFYIDKNTKRIENYHPISKLKGE